MLNVLVPFWCRPTVILLISCKGHSSISNWANLFSLSKFWTVIYFKFFARMSFSHACDEKLQWGRCNRTLNLHGCKPRLGSRWSTTFDASVEWRNGTDILKLNISEFQGGVRRYTSSVVPMGRQVADTPSCQVAHPYLKPPICSSTGDTYLYIRRQSFFKHLFDHESNHYPCSFSCGHRGAGSICDDNR